jgi:hypothetical protein
LLSASIAGESLIAGFEAEVEAEVEAIVGAEDILGRAAET